MKVLSSLKAARPFRGGVVTVGNFDGVHRGHARVIGQVVKRAGILRVPSVVVTFHPHTQSRLSVDRRHPVLTTRPEKERLIRDLGVDVLLVLPFTLKLQKMDAVAFLENIIFNGLAPREIVFGHDHRFGRGRAGDYALLKKICVRRRLRVGRVNALSDKGRPVSSTILRELVVSGKIEAAAEALGHPYLVSGRVVKGRGVGRTLGYPTANLALPAEKLLMPDGVYAGTAEVGGRTLPALVSLGTRPTFGGRARVLEAHLPGFTGNLYRRPLDLFVERLLRPQLKMPSAAALRRRIASDVKRMNQTINTKKGGSL